MQSDHEEIERSVAAYVLGALEPGEVEALDAHLSACADCRAVAARLARVVAVIPAANEVVAPPARLRARILAAAAGAQRAESSSSSRIRRLPRPPAFHLRWRAPSWAVAALVASVVAFALGTGIGLQIGRTPTAPSGSTQYVMSGTGRLSTATARVFSLHQEAVIFVDFKGLPQPSPGRVYEVWIIPPSGAPLAAGTFVPDADGSKVLVLGRTFTGQVVMAVTAEPGPAGSLAPTEEPSMQGKVA